MAGLHLLLQLVNLTLEATELRLLVTDPGIALTELFYEMISFLVQEISLPNRTLEGDDKLLAVAFHLLQTPNQDARSTLSMMA